MGNRESEKQKKIFLGNMTEQRLTCNSKKYCTLATDNGSNMSVLQQNSWITMEKQEKYFVGIHISVQI